jgi:transposase-like protein
VVTFQNQDVPHCPRCRTDAQFLGSGYDGDSTWFLCPTCRYAWQRTQTSSGGGQLRSEAQVRETRYRATA